mmetsp:Transcript_20010/g.56709  ORF Transcript_20010/g.56709 Transcript_20010/m.56709 type:complete len:253 (-) Transcript_20010:285-1043(-)
MLRLSPMGVGSNMLLGMPMASPVAVLLLLPFAPIPSWAWLLLVPPPKGKSSSRTSSAAWRMPSRSLKVRGCDAAEVRLSPSVAVNDGGNEVEATFGALVVPKAALAPREQLSLLPLPYEWFIGGCCMPCCCCCCAIIIIMTLMLLLEAALLPLLLSDWGAEKSSKCWFELGATRGLSPLLLLLLLLVVPIEVTAAAVSKYVILPNMALSALLLPLSLLWLDDNDEDEATCDGTASLLMAFAWVSMAGRHKDG